MGKKLNIFEAAILLKMSPNLLKWFTSYAPKFKETRKLNYVDCKDDVLFFNQTELIAFNQYLSMPWPSKKEEKRPRVPSGIEDEIKAESKFRCVICRHASAQVAHIDPINNSKNNHPHNLIYLCPNCHDLYDNKKNIKRKQIKNIKDELLQTKIVIWKSYTTLMDSVSSLIKELVILNSKKFNNKELQNEAIKELLDEIKNHTFKEFDAHPIDSKEHEKPKVYVKYKEKLRAIFNENVDVEEKLIEERNNYIKESGKEECPLCMGTGVHNEWKCPICRGVGTVDEALNDDIDLAPFEQEECPLCKGSGDHNEWECPICRGVGTVDQAAIDEIDLTPFDQEECPLCRGTGGHNEGPCPICRGVGTVDQAAIDEIDLTPFDQEECPLCKGTGGHNEGPCTICRGVGTVDQAAIDEIDLTPFDQEECPLCRGTGGHNEGQCPICRGVGTVDQAAIDEIDLTPFDQEECPLCRGTGGHNEGPCPICRGVGTVDQAAIDDIDLTPFEL